MTAARRSASTKRPRSSKAQSAGASPIRLTNPDRVFYPEAGITKAMLAAYDELVAPHMLPHVANRPLSLLRCPEGHAAGCFYQKHWTAARAGRAADAVRSVRLRDSRGSTAAPVIDDARGLVALRQMGTLEIHPWGSRADDPEHPDRLVFDLDPGPGVAWAQVVEAARTVKSVLCDVKLTSFVQTSGGKGLHVVMPIAPDPPWDEVKSFAHQVARALAAHDPDRYIATASKAKRRGRIFIDYLRNARGATSVAPYSTRARPNAPIAMPVTWRELGQVTGGAHFTLAGAARRLEGRRHDPWPGYFDLSQALPR